MITVDLGPLEVGVLTFSATRSSGKPLLRLVLQPWSRGEGGNRRRQRRFPDALGPTTPEGRLALGVIGAMGVGGGLPWDMTFTDDAVEAPLHPRFESLWKPS